MREDIKRDEFLRKRAERQRRIRKRRLKIFFTFFTIFLIGLSIVLCLTVFFPIENLTAKGSKIYSSEQIIKASGIEIGDNLFAIASGSVLKKIKAELPYVKSLDLDRELEGNLCITVKDATEYACFYDSKSYYTVSKEGWVLKKTLDPPENIFTVTGAKVKCKVGTEIIFEDVELQELNEKIVTALTEEGLLINSIDISDKIAISLRVENRFNVNLGNANFIPEKIRHLASMVENISEEKSGRINLSMWTNDNTQGTFVEETNE